MMEKWVDIAGFENVYQVSNKGRVRSLDRVQTCKNGVEKSLKGKVLSAIPNSQGYYRVELKHNGKSERWFVHRLVAVHFVKNANPKKYNVVNHIDSNHTNNCANNLEWTDLVGNAQHALKNGRLNRTTIWLQRQRDSLKKYDRPVAAYSYDCGRLVEKFSSIQEAGRRGYQPSCIVLCCNGKRQFHKGLIWRYVE